MKDGNNGKVKVFIGIKTKDIKNSDGFLYTSFAFLDKNFCQRVLFYDEDYKIYEFEIELHHQQYNEANRTIQEYQKQG